MVCRREAIFRMLGLAIAAGTPMRADARPGTTIQKPQIVAQRCLALFAVIARAYNDKEISGWVSTYGIQSYFSAMETTFFYALDPAQKLRINYSWQAEALVPLLWALKHIPSLPPANLKFDVVPLIKTLRLRENPRGFIEKAQLRSSTEIFDAREDIYEAHWTIRDARLFNKAMPKEFDPEIVQERHHALNWLAGDSGNDWDNVSTDT